MFVRFSNGFVVNINQITNFFVNNEHPFVTVEFATSSGADNRAKTISVPIAEYYALATELEAKWLMIRS